MTSRRLACAPSSLASVWVYWYPVRAAAGCAGTLHPGQVFLLEAARLRGERQGAPAPCTAARGLRPFDPRFDAFVCQASGAYACGQIGAGSGRCEFRHNGGMRRWLDRAASITCRGFGGALRPQWGARGAEPARILCRLVTDWEREGRSPLANHLRECISREREGRSPLASIRTI
jgi:hypothetical protein